MAESSAPIQATARTGETCRQAGPYRSGGRLRLIVFFKPGDRFPNDSEGRSTGWTLMTETISRESRSELNECFADRESPARIARCSAPPVLALSWLSLAPLVAAGAACPLELVGTWKSSDGAEITPRVISFTPDGWANVLNGPGEQSPLDIVAQVRYQAQPPRDPRRIDFETRRGNDVFPAGTTRWEVTSHADNSFTTRRSDDTSGTQLSWSRVPTHRYFLTFAARRDHDNGLRARLS